jgi:uncharacterized membrane protein (UPF0127 family)
MACSDRVDSTSDARFNPTLRVTIADSAGNTIVQLAAETAITDAEQQRGLMGRSHLPDRGGMLFLNEVEEERVFWMKNTPLSLDLLFINAANQIVSMKTNQPPYTLDPIPSEVPAQYVLEMKAGFADRYGLRTGMRVTWTEL